MGAQPNCYVMIDIIFRGILLGLAITAPIGPTNIEVIRRGLKEGWRSAFIFCVGVMVALVLYLVLVVYALSFLTQSELFTLALLLFGVVVLFYLSYNSIRDFFNKKELDLSGEVDSRKNFVQGIILTISNPAVILLWTGIMGADLAASQESLNTGLLLSFGILIGVFAFFISLSTIIHGGRQFITKKNFRYISLAAGLVLLYFGITFGYKLILSII